MIISIVCVVGFDKDHNSRLIYLQYNTSAIAGPIYKDSVDVPFDKVKTWIKPNRVCLLFGTYARKNTSNYKLSVLHDGEVVEVIRFNAKNIKNNDFNCFDIEPLDINNIKSYSLRLSPIDATKKNSITVYTDKTKTNPAMNMYHVQHKTITYEKAIIITAFVLLFLLVNYFINTKKMKPEKMWLIFGFIYLIPAMLLVPPYQVPDEYYHFFNSYNLSEFNFNKSIYENSEKEYFNAPANIKCLDYSTVDYLDKVYDIDDVSNCIREGNTIKYGYGYYKSHNFKIAYFFSALGIRVADTFSNSPMVIFYAGRLANLLVTIIVVYFCIRLVPKKKDLILSISTIPMMVFQFGSYSYDAMFNLACIVIFTTILKLIYDDKPNWKISIPLLLGLGFLIATIKFVYMLVFLLFVLVPDDKFKNKISKYVLTFILTFVPYALFYVMYKIINSPTAASVVVTGTVATNKASGGINNLFSLSYLINLYRYTFNVHGYQYMQQIFGTFGWLKFSLGNTMTYIYLTYIGYLGITNAKIKAKKIDNVILFCTFIFIIVAIFGGFYLWTLGQGVDDFLIEGVQGRYFLPILPIFILFLMPKKKWIEKDFNFNYGFINIMLLYYIFVLLLFYY